MYIANVAVVMPRWRTDNMSPRVFVSYSWDDDEHKAWARALAERLREDGVDATIDQWATVPGDHLPTFMERAIAEHEFVLVVCTPRYKGRSEKREGGVGYEGDIMTAELLEHRNHRKFIPVLRRGEWVAAAPGWLKGKYHVDLRDGPKYEEQYQDLLSTFLGQRAKAPPLGTRKPQTPTPAPVTSAAPVAEQPHELEPIRIVGVIADEVGEPRNDGTRGSALYEVPFRLSRTPSADWGDVFEAVWNRPPRFTSMHRPGIARVYGDRIVLDGTTIDEVQRYHRDTLVLCVEETNKKMAEYEARQRQQEEARRHASEEHKRQVREQADRIRFDE